MKHFSDSINSQILTKKSPIVVGIDPNFDLLPQEMRPRYLEKYEINGKLWEFVKPVLDVTADLVCGVKFQSAYFEQFGSWGVRVLAKSVQYAKGLGLTVIMDAKRGDIGSTSEAYTKAYLNSEKTFDNFQFTSYLDSDAVTINPFLGLDTMEHFVEASKKGKGVFVLVKTSNPGSGFIQDAMIGNKTVSESLAEYINNEGLLSIGESGYSNLGAVVGATKQEDSVKLRSLMKNNILLAPGIGIQGGSVDNIKNLMDKNGLGVLIPISRAITYPKPEAGKIWKDQVRTECQKFVEIFQ